MPSVAATLTRRETQYPWARLSITTGSGSWLSMSFPFKNHVSVPGAQESSRNLVHVNTGESATGLLTGTGRPLLLKAQRRSFPLTWQIEALVSFASLEGRWSVNSYWEVPRRRTVPA